MHLTVNGTTASVADGATVADLVSAHSAGHDRVAVAVNGDVVPRTSWPRTPLSAGDRVELLAPTAGG